MNQALIHRISMEQLFGDEDAWELFREYANESSIREMPPFNPDVDLYIKLEQSGVLRCLGSFVDNVLVGFGILLVTQNPHYSVRIATVESVFVTKAHRDTGAGLKLIYALKRQAKEQGAVALFASAPTHSQLDRVLSTMGWAHTNQVYCRSLN